MKYILIPIIALSFPFLLLLGWINGLDREISELKARDRLQSMEIMALRGHLGVVEDNIQQMKEEARAFSHIIPIDKGWLGIREEK